MTIFPNLEYRCSTGIGARIDAGDYLLGFHVGIKGEYEDKLGQIREIHLGELRFTLIRLGQALNDGADTFSIFDQSQDIQNLSASLFEPDLGEFVEAIRETFQVASPFDDLLFVQSVVLEPFARGQRLGISALHRVITDWASGCSLIALEATPPQFVSDREEGPTRTPLERDAFSKDEKQSREKLEHHFCGLGIQKLEALPYLLLSPQERQMPVTELALVDSIDLPPECFQNN